jgi:hypothetical protein
MAKDVFQPKIPLPGTSWIYKAQAKGAYDHKALESKIQDLSEKYLGDRKALFSNRSDGCKVYVSLKKFGSNVYSSWNRFVCAAQESGGTLIRLRTYRSGSEEAVPCYIWEAARATSASPTFFDKIQFEKGDRPTFVDGALKDANNPVEELHNEILEGGVFPAHRPIRCLVSIGTGIPEIKAFGPNLKRLVEKLQDVATDAEKIANRFWSNHKDQMTGRYFRFNVENGLQGIGMDEHKSATLIVERTIAYLKDAKQVREELKQCVEKLRLKERVSIPPARFRRVIEHDDTHCYLTTDMKEIEAIANTTVQEAIEKFPNNSGHKFPEDFRFRFWACNLMRTQRDSTNLRCLQRNVPGNTYRVFWNFAYIYRATTLNGNTIDWTKQHQVTIICLAGRAVDERQFLARTTDPNEPWISSNFDDIISSDNRVMVDLKLPILGHEDRRYASLHNGYIGSTVKLASPWPIEVESNGTVAFLIRKVGGGAGDGWLYFLGCELVP